MINMFERIWCPTESIFLVGFASFVDFADGRDKVKFEIRNGNCGLLIFDPLSYVSVRDVFNHIHSIKKVFSSPLLIYGCYSTPIPRSGFRQFRSNIDVYQENLYCYGEGVERTINNDFNQFSLAKAMIDSKELWTTT